MENLELIYFCCRASLSQAAEGSLDVQLHSGAVLTIGAHSSHHQMQFDKFWMSGAFDGSDRLDVHAFHSVTMTASGLGTIKLPVLEGLTLVRSFSCP